MTELILTDNITAYLQSLDSKKIVIGFSGGPDSVATYNIISDYYTSQNRNSNDIYLAHYNHKFRPESDGEAKLIQNNYKNIIYGEYTGNIFSERDLRIARHMFFKNCMKKAGTKTLILGHNLSDRFETTIMNIQRGAGANGIANMQEIDEKEYLLITKYTILRPILQYPKYHITEHCDHKGLYYFTDHTNTDSDVSERNHIRTTIINPINQGNIRQLQHWRIKHKHRLHSSLHNEFEELFTHYFKDDSLWSGIRSRYAVNYNYQIIIKPTLLPFPRYCGFDYIYQIPRAMGEHEFIYILKGIDSYSNISQSYIAEFIYFLSSSKNGYKEIGAWKLYNCHNKFYLIKENSCLNAGQVLDFWLQYDNNIIRLVDLHADLYNGKPVNKRFINNKIPVFLRHIVPVDRDGIYKDNLIIQLLHNSQ